MPLITTHSEVKAEDFAKSINSNVKIESGINWFWANGFSNREQAETFDRYCLKNGLETRGVYKHGWRDYAVRYRY